MRRSILVFGGNGTVGRPLVANLLGREEHVLVTSRQGNSVAGASGIRFEFGTGSDFGALLTGVDRVFLLLPAGYPRVVATVCPLIEAAAARRIKIVYLSALGAGEHKDHDHARVEKLLESSKTPFVSIRPNWFSDNFHSLWKPDILLGNLVLPAGQAKSSFIDARDVAECAAAALTRDTFDGGAFDLTGPEALSYADAAGILSAALERPIRYTPLTEDEYVRVRTAEGMPPAFAKTVADIFEAVRNGETAIVTNGVATLTGGHAPRSLATYARDHVADFSAGT